MSYRAVVDLWYPASPAMVRRLERGENVPMNKRGMKVARAGSTVTDLPAASIPNLLAKGRIVEVPDGA